MIALTCTSHILVNFERDGYCARIPKEALQILYGNCSEKQSEFRMCQFRREEFVGLMQTFQ